MTREKTKDPLLTTHQVAQLLGAEPSSVIRWFDKGILTGWRTPGGHRRIRQSSVAAYLRGKGMDVPAELGGKSGAAAGSAMAPLVEDGLRRLMWIDDDASFLLSVGRALRSYDDRVKSLLLDDPVEALVELVRFRPHLIVLDVQMPGLDGLRVCRSLKARPDCSDVGIILVTGFADEELRREAAEAGANAVLSKPITIEQLLGPLGVKNGHSSGPPSYGG